MITFSRNQIIGALILLILLLVVAMARFLV